MTPAEPVPDALKLRRAAQATHDLWTATDGAYGALCDLGEEGLTVAMRLELVDLKHRLAGISEDYRRRADAAEGRRLATAEAAHPARPVVASGMSPVQRRLVQAAAETMEANGGRPVLLTARWWADRYDIQTRTWHSCRRQECLSRARIGRQWHWTVTPRSYRGLTAKGVDRAQG